MDRKDLNLYSRHSGKYLSIGLCNLRSTDNRNVPVPQCAILRKVCPHSSPIICVPSGKVGTAAGLHGANSSSSLSSSPLSLSSLFSLSLWNGGLGDKKKQTCQ